jgi:hypothetical protein
MSVWDPAGSHTTGCDVNVTEKREAWLVTFGTRQ